jgi:hypothetical protein
MKLSAWLQGYLFSYANKLNQTTKYSYVGKLFSLHVPPAPPAAVAFVRAIFFQRSWSLFWDSFPCDTSLCKNLFFFFFWDRVSLCNPGCLGTHSVDQAGLKLRNLPASASRVLGSKACTTNAQILCKNLKAEHETKNPMFGTLSY